jgi:putative two-component system response regulator
MSLSSQFRATPLDWPLPGQEAKDVRILILDDQEIIRVQLRRILKKNGFTVLEAPDAQKALEILNREPVDLLLSDIRMPGMTGLDLMRTMAHRIPDIAVIMVSGVDNMEMAMECLEVGAYGYVLKPFKTSGILIAVANALRRRMLELEHRDREAILAHKVREQTEEIRASREEISYRLLSASEHRDNETGAHVRRIGLYAAEMTRILGWDVDAVDCIRAAAPMHDIGKIGVPDRILQKDGPLTEEEWIIMKTHTTMGANILRESGVPFIQMGARIAASHHERFDGTGYPGGLAGTQIPLEARITGLVDVYDALCSKRVYKHAWTEEDALGYLKEQQGRHFDPSLLGLFLDHYENFRRIFLDNPDRYAPEEIPLRRM